MEAEPLVVTPPTIVDASIANGSHIATYPTWQALTISAINSGTGATIVGGNLSFTATGLAVINWNITVQLATANKTVYFGAKWDSGAIQALGSFELQSTQPQPVVITRAVKLGTVLTLYISSDDSVDPIVWTAGDIKVVSGQTQAFFPAFDPIVPPPLIGQGGGPPPTFPPPTPPPIGVVPPGVLVGPAIAPAGVPPSLAGVTQPQFAYGNATTPAVTKAFPEFTTTFPTPPVIVNATQNTNTPVWVAPPQPPPHQNSTLLIPAGTLMGPPIGPALPNPIPPRQFAA